MGTSARKSVFQEVGVDDFEPETSSSRRSSTASESSSSRKRPSPGVRFRSKDDVRFVERYEDADLGGNDYGLSSKSIPSTTTPTQSPLPGSKSIMYRLGAIALLVVAAVPFLHGAPSLGHASLPLQPVSGGPIRRDPEGPILDKRADSPTDVCFRWAGQCMLNISQHV